MTVEDMRPFRILSIDGGGIRGAFAAAFLADIEERLNSRLADFFDLIVGTSTGGIIAAAIALREPAQRIERLYRERGPTIFRRRSPPAMPWGLKVAAWCFARVLKRYGLEYDQLWQSKYDSVQLRSALVEIFGEKRVEDSRTRLVIPSVDLTRGQTVVFKTPHLPGLVRDRHFYMVDVLMATTAAPTYFPHAVIQDGSVYLDGGLWANNPSMVAIAEALQISKKCCREGVDQPIAENAITLLSVGTGRSSYFGAPPRGGAGIMWWAPSLFNVCSISQAQGVTFQARYVLGERFYRVDYDLPDSTWTLDNVGMLTQMTHLGHERSIESFSKLQPVFFTQPSQHSYRPFPET